MQQMRDWQLQQHINFSHHNHLHRSVAPRSSREVFGSSMESNTSNNKDACVLTAALLVAMTYVILTLAEFLSRFA